MELATVMKQIIYRGSTISNNSGSVVLSHTSNALVFLNSEIHNGLKSSVELG